jgi:hypothetical protein
MTRYSRLTLLLSWATPLTTVLLRLMQRLQVDTVVILRSESISIRSPSGEFPASSPGQTSYRSRIHLLRTYAGPSIVSNSATEYNARERGIVGQEMCNRTVYHEDDLEAVKCQDYGMAGSMHGFHGRVAALYHSHSCQWRGLDVIVTWWDSAAPLFCVQNNYNATTLREESFISSSAVSRWLFGSLVIPTGRMQEYLAKPSCGYPCLDAC